MLLRLKVVFPDSLSRVWKFRLTIHHDLIAEQANLGVAVALGADVHAVADALVEVQFDHAAGLVNASQRASRLRRREASGKSRRDRRKNRARLRAARRH